MSPREDLTPPEQEYVRDQSASSGISEQELGARVLNTAIDTQAAKIEFGPDEDPVQVARDAGIISPERR